MAHKDFELLAFFQLRDLLDLIFILSSLGLLGDRDRVRVLGKVLDLSGERFLGAAEDVVVILCALLALGS